MRCVLLAAGGGKRMRPLTYTRPKVMLPVANKPLLEWNLINAINAGFDDFIFILGYKSEMVRTYFGDGKKWNVSIEYVNQGRPSGTAHAVGMVEPFVDDFVVLCGDTIFGKEDIKQVTGKKISIGLTEVEDAKEYGVAELDNKKLVRIHEKMEKPFSNIINAGIYHFDKSVFDFIKQTEKSPRGEYEITDSINSMIEEFDIEGVFLKEWMDVVYPWHLLDANEEILKKMKGKNEGLVEKNAVLKGEVVVGRGSKIMNGSYVEGPVIMGENCRIGPNCYIRPYTSIGNNCHVGNACEVKNSIIMDESNVPHQNYVGDSVIGQGCNLGAGTKIANLRLDKKNIYVSLNCKRIFTGRRKVGAILGDNVQTGINAMLNAGSVIGNKVFIGPGAITNGEIKPHTRIM